MCRWLESISGVELSGDTIAAPFAGDSPEMRRRCVADASRCGTTTPTSVYNSPTLRSLNHRIVPPSTIMGSPNTIAIAAGKGGVLKTTLACHLAAAATASYCRVLLVDLDPQGNTALDFGFASDGGRSLARALTNGDRPEPLRDIRARIDVLPGGRHLDAAALTLTRSALDDGSVARVLSQFDDEYDLIVVDCPARELVLRRAALSAAAFVVVPSNSDMASYHGLADLAATITEVRRAGNDELEVLAVVAGPVPSNATGLRGRTLAELGRLIGDPSLLVSTTVRASHLTAERCRAGGQTTAEYAAQSQNPASVSLAEDWAAITREIIHRHLAAVAPSRSGNCL